MTKAVLEQSKQLVETSRMRFNDWNPNELTGQAREALREDMQKNGVNGIKPIKVTPRHTVFPAEKDLTALLVIDGEQRGRLALELKWPEIWVEVDYGILDKPSAMLETWKTLWERGGVNAFKEGAFYKSLVDQGLSQRQVAERARVSPEQVSRRIALAALPEGVRAYATSAQKLTVSHLEPLIGLPKEKQIELAKHIVSQMMSVREVEFGVQRAKRELVEEERLAKAVENAKFEKCPTCKKGPEELSYKGAPWVRCKNYHVWNVQTGKIELKYAGFSSSGHARNAPFPDYVRTTHTPEEFAIAVTELIKRSVPNLSDCTHAIINGSTHQGEEFHVRWERNTVSVHDGMEKTNFSYESKEYAIKSLKHFRGAVRGGSVRSPKDAQQLEEAWEKFLSEYKPSAKPAKKTPAKVDALADAPTEAR